MFLPHKLTRLSLSLSNHPQEVSFGQGAQPVYVVPQGQQTDPDTLATLDNTQHAADCQNTAVYCSNREACCTKTCKLAKGFQSRVCCLPEGSLCDSSPKGNPGLALCCAGMQCMPMKTDSSGLGDSKISACQVMPAGG